MVNVPIVDAHVHLWDPEYYAIPWLQHSPLLNKRYALEEYAEHTAGLPIEGIVYLEVDVERSYALIEPRWVAALAQQEPRIQAIVATAPVEHGTRCRSYLEALVATSPLVKGVRRLLQGEKDPGFPIAPDLVRGVQLLPEYGLSFDICIRRDQLPAAIELVRRCPETSFMLDHIANPNIREREFEPWASRIVELAALPNVTCKVSGVATNAVHDSWTPEDLAPYINHILDSFGEDRVAFGGDWPVVLGASSYRRWVEALDQITATRSEAARRKLWGENARRFYRF